MGTKMLSVALAAIALGAVTVAPASAAPEGNPIIEITSVAREGCLQPEAATASFYEVATCDDTQNQRFEQIPLDDGRYLLRSLTTRYCMDTTYGLWADVCDDGSPVQAAELVPDEAGTVRIRFGELYADTTEQVWAWEHADTDHQRWRVRQTGTTTPVDTTGQVVRIASVHGHSYGCVTPTGYSTTVHHQPCADGPEQRFQRVETGGSTMLRNIASGKCLSAKAGGTNAYEFDCDPADAKQQWTFEQLRTGDVRLRLSAEQRYLTPVGRELWITTASTSFPTTSNWHVTLAQP